MTLHCEEVCDGFLVLEKALYFDDMQATIPETPAAGDNVSYAVHVSKGDGPHWVVDKRFSDFQTLVSTLRSTRRAQRSQIPALPPTHLFRATNRDPVLLEERRTGLNAFLLALLRSELAHSSAVLLFLEAPEVLPLPILSPAALKRLQAGFRWTCQAHVLHFRSAPPPGHEKLNGSFVDAFPVDQDAGFGTRDTAAAAAATGMEDDGGFRVPNVSLSSQTWVCSGVNRRAGIGAVDADPDDDQESPLWHELAAFHWRGISPFNLNRSLRCGAGRFKAHFKKDSGRVRVAMNPIALYTAATPCPQAFLGSGVLYSSDDVQVCRGRVMYAPRQWADDASPNDTDPRFLLPAPFRLDTAADYKLFVHVANSLRCKLQDARTLFKLLQLYDPVRARDLLRKAQAEAASEEGRDYEMGSWVDLEQHRSALHEDEGDGSNPATPTAEASGADDAPTPTAATPDRKPPVQMPTEPVPEIRPVHLRVVERDLTILLSFTVFNMLLRRHGGSCEIIFLGSNEFVALRGGKFALHTWDPFREREDRETDRRDEDSPRSLFDTDPPPDCPDLPPFTF